MSTRQPFDDMLGASIDALRSGQPLDAVLAQYPQHASALLPLLEAALGAEATADAAYVAPSERLQQNYSKVRSASESQPLQ